MVTVHSAPFAKPPLRGSPLLRSSFLLIRRRSLRTFMQADFHASMKSAHRNVRVNCNFECSKDHRSLYPVLCIMRFLERNVFFNCNVFYIYIAGFVHMPYFAKFSGICAVKRTAVNKKPVRSGEYPHTCRPAHPLNTGRTGSSSSAHKPSKPLPWRSSRLSRRFPPGRQSFCADGFQQSLQSW